MRLSDGALRQHSVRMTGVNQIRRGLPRFLRQGRPCGRRQFAARAAQRSTLMFANSGMVQFKNVFTGVEEAALFARHHRAKCVRAGSKHNDLDNVGYTAGITPSSDARQFLLRRLFQGPRDRTRWNLITKELRATGRAAAGHRLFRDDDAFQQWKKIAGLPDSRSSAFRPRTISQRMGDTGPCGPIRRSSTTTVTRSGAARRARPNRTATGSSDLELIVHAI